MTAFFISASGTGIGKTLVTAALAYHLHSLNKKVIVQKPIISGWENTPEKVAQSDTGLLLSAIGQPLTEESIRRTSPWRFSAPLSPHIAARQEEKIIDPDAVVAYSRSCGEVLDIDEYLLIEGVGGAMVPLTDGYHSLHWMQSLRFPVVLVAGDYLGAISHTLTTLEALNAYHIQVRAIVVSGSEHPPMPTQMVVETLQGFTPVPIVMFPFVTSHEDNIKKYTECSRYVEPLLSQIMR